MRLFAFRLLARLLLSYGLALPAAAYVEWLRQLAPALRKYCPEHFMPDEHNPDAALWLLRLAHALALAWPLHLTLGAADDDGNDGGRGGGGQEEALPSPAAVEELWRVRGSAA